MRQLPLRVAQPLYPLVSTRSQRHNQMPRGERKAKIELRRYWEIQIEQIPLPFETTLLAKQHLHHMEGGLQLKPLCIRRD